MPLKFTAVLRIALCSALFAATVTSGPVARAEGGDLCLFGEERDGACVGPESAFDEAEAGEESAEAAAVRIVLVTLSPLRPGMTPEQAIAAVGRDPLKDLPAVTIGFPEIQLDGSYRVLLWDREVEFLETPLQLFAMLEEDRVVAVWLVPRSGSETYAESIAATDCDAFTDFLKGRYGPEGSLAQLEERFFDHETNVYQEGGLKWAPETRNLNALAAGELWFAYHTTFTAYSNFKRNGVHHDRLDACRSQVMVARRG